MYSLVSVIIPTKNSARTIGKCLESIKNQSYSKIEIIVVDNSSTDGTADIARQYTDKVYTQWPERTTQKNHGIAQATGKYLLIIDGDMSIDVELISDCVKQMEWDEKSGWVCIPVVDTWSSFWTRVIAYERSFYKGTSMEAARFLRADLVRQVWGYKDIIFYEEFIVPQEIEQLGYNVRLHTEYNIYHDYDDFTFIGNLKKKYYYGKSLKEYQKQLKKLWIDNHSENQTWVLHRYMVFLGNRRFYTRPILAVGVLVLKSMEFGFGGFWIIKSKIW